MQIAGSRFAVLGGAGFIGSHVVDQLLAAGAEHVVVLDDLRRGKLDNLANALRDGRCRLVEGGITDGAAVRRALSGADGVFLLAALWLDECARDPRSAWEVNVLGTWNVIEVARENQMPRVVFSSSASVYGNAEQLPMEEDHPYANRTVYGATKIAGEQMLRSAAAGWGQPFLGLRYMNVYGPRMDDRGAYVSVIVRNLERLARGEAPVVHGDGSQTFDFVHVRDVARANLLAMANDHTDEFINVGTGRGTTILELAHLMSRTLGMTLPPVFVPARDLFVTQRVGSTRKAQDLLGFRAEVDMPSGIADVLAWWRERAPETRAVR